MERFNALMTELTMPFYALLDWLEVSAARRWLFGLVVGAAVALVVTADWLSR